MTSQYDEVWMRRALKLAEKGQGLTSPNPVVGACVVKNGRLVSEGFHRYFGGPHAEIEALQKAGEKAHGATLYVTLEPCSTYGKTPPCTEAIKKAKISQVVIGAIDPNPKHRRQGVSLLKKLGIRVRARVLRSECELQNEAFSKWTRTGIPFVILKMAQSLDGKIASRTGESRWISGPQARNWVHGLRASVDAILVGKNTVLQDDPRLTVRPRLVEKGSERNGTIRKTPWRIILDEKGASSPQARIFQSQGPVILVCSKKLVQGVTKKFQRVKVTILPVGSNHGRLDLSELLKCLGSLGIASLLVEGGGEVAWSFFEGKFVDKIEWVVAPKIIGGRDAKTSVEGFGVKSLAKTPMIRWTRTDRLGTDILLEGYVKH